MATDTKPENASPANGTVDTSLVDSVFSMVGQNTAPMVTRTPVRSKTEVPAAVLRQPARVRRPVPAETEPAEEPTTWYDWIGKAALAVGVVCAAYFFLKATPNSPLNSRPAHSTMAASRTPAGPRLVTQDIQDVNVGQRIMGENPLREQVDPDAPEPNPETWRKLVLRMEKESGRELRVNLLRPVEWIEQAGAEEGGLFYLNLPEMGAVGDAHVVAIEPCPPIESGRGNVVTGTFHHEADPDVKILQVEFSDGAVIKGVTDNHPFWSEDRQDFVPVGELKQGDRVRTQNGITSITSMSSRYPDPGEMLYNLETHNEHVYQVTTAGILVHNSCSGLSSIEKIRFRGARRIDSLRKATHQDITKAFKGTGFKPSSHFISRVKDIRTERLGLKSFDDLEAIFRHGNIVNADKGLRAIVRGNMAVVFDPKSGVLVTLTPW